MNRSTVMIVDDHAIVRGGLVSLLATTDDLAVVGEAESGADAVRMAAELRPDLVLMDLSMPGELDGVGATRGIRAHDPEVRILVLTSMAERTWIMQAVEAGADGYLLKHSEPEVILSGIREVIAGGSPLDPQAARAVLSSRRAEAQEGIVLTPREEEVLRMVTEGFANKAIARRLGITERTVKSHLTHIFQRLGVADRTQAALWATRRASERGRGY